MSNRPTIIVKECQKHGHTNYRIDRERRYRCVKCRSEYSSNCRKEIRKRLVDHFGGKCSVCSYSKYAGNLHFHHIDARTKEFNLSGDSSYGFERGLKEALKCILVCANHHGEIHAGLISPLDHLPEVRRAEFEYLRDQIILDRRAPENDLVTSFSSISTEIIVKKVAKEEDPRYKCPNCNQRKLKLSSLCKACFNLNRNTKIEWPDFETLKKMVVDTNYVATGRALGVTDNAVRKRLKKL